MRLAIVAPHIFMQQELLTKVIFSPGELAISLADELSDQGQEVTIFTPGKVITKAKNINGDLSFFETELKIRGDNYLDLLKKHPLTFISLSRQVQSELLATAFEMANNNKFDVVHVYMNEEDNGIIFSRFCKKPVVLTHHDPYSFLVKYRSVFPKYVKNNWISMSLAQRHGMPSDTNWIGNVYHGLPENLYTPSDNPAVDYFLFMGRIIKPKGLHLAIQAVKEYNKSNQKNNGKTVPLLIAGKHYSGDKDNYWQKILPEIDDREIKYLGFIKDIKQKNKLLANSKALIIPSTFDEPFGMVMIEALASGTPIIGLDSGAIPEVINKNNGILVKKILGSGEMDEAKTVEALRDAMCDIENINRDHCRIDFLSRFTLSEMASKHLQIYKKVTNAK